LGGQSLIVSKDKGRAAGGLNDFSHRERLAGTGDSKQYLVFIAAVNSGAKLFDRGGLIASGFVTDA
jgi:hypothetical protein